MHINLPLVSIIIVTRNRFRDLCELIDSILAQTYKNYEIIVVDNDSDDQTPQIPHIYKARGIRYFQAKENLGCPGGRNYAVQKARGEYIFFLDDDATIDKKTIEKVVQRFQIEKELGVIGIATVDYYFRDRVTTAFSPVILGEEERYYFNFSGGACCISKWVFDKVGMYQQNFFYGAEERDLSYRILSAGIRILYYPKVKLYHKRAIEGRNQPGKLKKQYLNDVHIYWKYYPLLMAIFATILKTIQYFQYFRYRSSLGEYFSSIICLPKSIFTVMTTQRQSLRKGVLRAENYLKHHHTTQWSTVENILNSS